MAIPSYRYLFTNLLTNKVIAELPLTGVTWGENLNDAGDFNGSILLSDLNVQKLGTTSILDSTVPGKTGVYVERNGNIEWGGILWTRQFDTDSQMIQLAGRSFISYLGKRRINKEWTVFDIGTDQFTIVKQLVDDAQAEANGNIGITTSGIGLCGQGIADYFAVFGYECRELLATISDLAKQGPPYGFDYSIDCSYDSSYNITRKLNLWYPRQGNIPQTAGPGNYLDFPGAILHYSWPEDAGSMVNRLCGFGPGSSDSQYTTTGIVQSSLDAGYPLYEDTTSYSQVPDPRLVDALVQAEVGARAVPVVTASVTWTTLSDNGPQPNTFSLGDQFNLDITDDRFPAGMSTWMRLTQYSVSVGDDGSPEIITGTFTTPTY